VINPIRLVVCHFERTSSRNWSSQKNHERSKTAKVAGRPDPYLHASVAVAAIVVLLPSPRMPKASRPQDPTIARPGAETWASFDLH
jgi:hypothetical protein